MLPSLAQCVANPALAGCTAVLPAFGQCIGNPGLPGCAAVLPTLSQCAASPVLQGCNVVLPPVSACVANPTSPGCVVVVPPASSLPTPPAQTVVAAIGSASANANAALLTTEMNALVSVNKQDEQKDDSVASVIEAVGDQRDVRKKTYCN